MRGTMGFQPIYVLAKLADGKYKIVVCRKPGDTNRLNQAAEIHNATILFHSESKDEVNQKLKELEQSHG